MNILDIHIKKERGGKVCVWLAQSWIVELFELSEKYIRVKARSLFNKSVPAHRRKQDIMPDTGKSWRYAKINGQFYYDYDRLPESRRDQLPTKAEIIEQYKSALEQDQSNKLHAQVKAGLDNYTAYLGYYNRYKDAHANSLSRACALLDWSVAHMDGEGISIKKNGFFKLLSKVVQDLDIKYLPYNYRRLKEKVAAVYNGQPAWEVVKLPREGNQVTKKYNDKEVISWMIQMRAMPQNYTNEHIIRKVRQMCVLTKKETPSRSWFTAKLAKNNTKWLTALGRHGEKGRHGQIYRGYTPIQNALYAGDCWQVDGTRVNFVGFIDKDGKEKFLYIIAIRDVHSGDVLGWHYDTKEDRWGYVHALKMAVNRAGYLPYELVVDRFPGHNTHEWKVIEGRLHRKGCKVTVTSKATGKASVERWFGTHQSVFMQESEWYYGEGVQSRRTSAHRSAEYIKKMKKKARRENWTFDDAWKEHTRIIDLYRNTKLSTYSRRYQDIDKTPAELHYESEKPHIKKIEPWRFIELFGLEKQVSIRNAGKISTEIQRVKYVYDVKEYDTLANYKQVTLCYDMEDLGVVHLFEPGNEINREYLGEAVEVRAAQIYGPDADNKDLGKNQARIKAIEEKRKAELADIVEVGSPVELLLCGMGTKQDAGAAETRLLNESIGEWKDDGRVRVLSQEPLPEKYDEDEEIVIDVRSQY